MTVDEIINDVNKKCFEDHREERRVEKRAQSDNNAKKETDHSAR